MPFDPRLKRTEGKLQGPDGSIFRITKVELVDLRLSHTLFLIAPDVWQGAPRVILNMCFNKEEIKAQVDAKVL